MTDPKDEGVLPEDSDSPKESTKEAPTSQEQDQETPPDILPEYQGKTPAELAQMLKDREGTISRQGEELGTLRNENAYFRSSTPQQPQRQQSQGLPAPQQSPQGSTEEDYDWTDPKAVKTFVTGIVAERDQQRNAIDAQNAFLAGHREAMKERPELFKDKEQEVGKLVEGFYRGSQGSQNPVTPDQLRNTDTWFAAAKLLDFQKTGFKDTPQTTVNPVDAPSTETPSSVKKQDLGEIEQHVELDYLSKEAAQDWGISEDRMKEIVRKEQVIDEKGRR